MESSNSNLFRHSLPLISSILCISIPTAFITEDICLKMGLPRRSFDTQRWSQGQARLQSIRGCYRGWYNRRVGFRGAKVGRRYGGNRGRMTIELEVWGIFIQRLVLLALHRPHGAYRCSIHWLIQLVNVFGTLTVWLITSWGPHQTRPIALRGLFGCLALECGVEELPQRWGNPQR